MAQASANQLLTRAAKGIKHLGRLESLTAQDANDGLDAANALIGSWAGERLMAFANQTISHTLSANTSSYTIGSGGDIDTTRPDNILQGWIRDTTNNIDFPMTQLSQRQFNNIGYKSNTSQIPTDYFYDPQYPLGTLHIFPTPTAAYEVRLNAMLQLTAFSTLTHSTSLPPVYERAYVLNLGLELVNYGFVNGLSPEEYATYVNSASEAKANLKRNNIKDEVAEYDSAIVARSEATYNVYSDGFPRG
jgi:hypothetical protein